MRGVQSRGLVVVWEEGHRILGRFGWRRWQLWRLDGEGRLQFWHLWRERLARERYCSQLAVGRLLDQGFVVVVVVVVAGAAAVVDW